MKDCTSTEGHEWSDETLHEIGVTLIYLMDDAFTIGYDHPVVTREGTSFVYCVNCGVDGYRMAAS